jgi:hypothetical protein
MMIYARSFRRAGVSFGDGDDGVAEAATATRRSERECTLTDIATQAYV